MEGDACGAWCQWCGRCEGGTPANAVCRACGNDYIRDEDSTCYWCDRCVANAHARAEVTVEQRQKPKPKAAPQPAGVGLAPEDVCR